MGNEEAILWVKVGIGLMMLITALEAWRMSAILHNDRLFLLGKKIFYALLIFGLLRIAASFVDQWMDWQFSWAAVLTTYAFWFATYAFFLRHRRILQKQVTPDELAKISESFDEIIENMRLVKIKLDTSLEKSEQPNPN